MVFKRQLVLLIALITLVFSSAIAMAQDEDKNQSDAEETSDTLEAVQSVTAEEDEPAFREEIEVVGERNFIGMRYQIARAEDDLYSKFNDMIDIEEYKVTCGRVTPTGSFIGRRRCEPKFLKDYRQLVSRNAVADMRQNTGSDDLDVVSFQRGIDTLSAGGSFREQTAGKFEEFNNELFRLASENPEILEALMRVDQLKQLLSDERIRVFGHE